VIFHVDLMLGNGGDMLVKRSQSMVLSRMYLMVDFFFILSGFIMFYVYGKMFASNVNKTSFKKFTVARFARVYPLHFFTLCYCIVLFFISEKFGIPKNPVLQIENSSFSIFTNTLLLHSMNFHNWFSWNHASWSISVEWWAYMLFPFLVAPISNMHSSKKAIIAMLCFIGYLAITFLIIPIVTVPKEIPFVKVDPSQLSINVAYQYGYIRCLCGFILGMMVYQAYSAKWLLQFFANGYILIGLTLVSFISMHFNLPDFITIIPFPFILLCGAYGSVGIDNFFANKFLQKLGDWSFSIYLVHQPLLFTIGNIVSYLNPIDLTKPLTGPPPKLEMLTGWLICIAFLIITLIISFITYHYIEVPARNKLNKKPLTS
ncbi:MAG: acyltransferase, partial [Deinococcales bacterium]|nr:acyltransferase [Chitinophagaceae bacterium]